MSKVRKRNSKWRRRRWRRRWRRRTIETKSTSWIVGNFLRNEIRRTIPKLICVTTANSNPNNHESWDISDMKRASDISFLSKWTTFRQDEDDEARKGKEKNEELGNYHEPQKQTFAGPDFFFYSDEKKTSSLQFRRMATSNIQTLHFDNIRNCSRCPLHSRPQREMGERMWFTHTHTQNESFGSG